MRSVSEGVGVFVGEEGRRETGRGKVCVVFCCVVVVWCGCGTVHRLDTVALLHICFPVVSLVVCT